MDSLVLQLLIMVVVALAMTLENLIAMLPSMALQSAWYLSNVTTPSDILTT